MEPEHPHPSPEGALVFPAAERAPRSGSTRNLELGPFIFQGARDILSRRRRAEFEGEGKLGCGRSAPPNIDQAATDGVGHQVDPLEAETLV
jgi:hypothetical protein